MNTTTTIDLTSIRLSSGSHGSREEGMCLLEAVAFFAGEPHTDRPQCVCPVLAAFGRSWNDGLESDDERDRLLKPLMRKLVNTKGTTDLQQRRAWMALDWLIRVCVPAWMDLTGSLQQHASVLRGLPPQINTHQLRLSAKKRDAARYAAGDAAGDAARAAARAAAGYAAWVAAGYAAWSAALDAAGYAAWSAALDAAGAAGGAKVTLTPTISVLKQSALQLFESMIALKD